MEHEDLLLTLSEIAVTLAALSGVAGIIGARSREGRIAEFEILLLRNVALIGMVVAAFALLPPVFRGSGASGATVWRLCSALALAWWLGAYGLFLRQAATPLRSGEFSAGTFSLGLALNVTGAILLGWNALWSSSRSPQRYVLALMCALALAVVNFVITALRPRPPAV
jgi:hypothetical protein